MANYIVNGKEIGRDSDKSYEYNPNTDRFNEVGSAYSSVGGYVNDYSHDRLVEDGIRRNNAARLKEQYEMEDYHRQLQNAKREKQAFEDRRLERDKKDRAWVQAVDRYYEMRAFKRFVNRVKGSYPVKMGREASYRDMDLEQINNLWQGQPEKEVGGRAR